MKRWSQDPAQRPWFDHTDAAQRLEARRHAEPLSERDVEVLTQWMESGYAVVKNVVPDADIDGMLGDLDALWTASTPIDNLTIADLRIDPADPPGMTHGALLSLDRTTRERVKRQCPWRIHGFHDHSGAAREIFNNGELSRLSSLILGRSAVPSFSINFTFGSSQKLHQDSAVFCVVPMNYLVGAWLACEDIHEDSGPLVYYPGSHRERLFEAFDNYPQTMLKTCTAEVMDAYHRHLDEVAQRYQRRRFIARKGDVLLWHGMLIHGGDAIRDRSRTRRSYVCHYLPPGSNREAEVIGPFNW